MWNPTRVVWEGTLKRSFLTLTVAAATFITGCDRKGEITIVPEFDLSYSFEGSLEQWYANGVDLSDPPVTWSVAQSNAEASLGSGSAELVLENANGRAKIWLERVFEVEPDREYDIEISFDFGSADGDAITPWRIIAGASTSAPESASDLTIQDATSQAQPGPNIEFGERRYTVRAAGDEEGRIYVALGVWGTTAAFRTYFIDNVRLLFTRVSLAG